MKSHCNDIKLNELETLASNHFMCNFLCKPLLVSCIAVNQLHSASFSPVMMLFLSVASVLLGYVTAADHDLYNN